MENRYGDGDLPVTGPAWQRVQPEEYVLRGEWTNQSLRKSYKTFFD
jgi:hypothetical protein